MNRNLIVKFQVAITASLILLAAGITGVFAQAPVISYGAYKLFTRDSAIIPLIPVNKGGEVPPAIYSKTQTFAGNDDPGFLDAAGTKARFNRPSKIAVDSDGNLYVADEQNNRIRKITPEGIVTTLAGNGKAGYENNSVGSKARFNGPSGIAVDRSGNVYVADVFNHMIRMISPSGAVRTFAGNGQPGSADDTNGLRASFHFPVDLAIDKAGNLYVADEGNNKIRKITPSGAVSSFAGNGYMGSFDSKVGITATFNQPNGIAIDDKGNLYIADQLNHIIRKITAAGAVSTLAGSGAAGSADNNVGMMASFNHPRGIAVDKAGNVYVGDVANQKIRKISPSGAVSTLSGSGAAGSQDNTNGSLAGFYFPNGLAADNSGNLFVADALNNKIRKIELKGYSISPELLPQGLLFDRTTGVLSGIPAEDIINSSYTITAYNTSGSSTTTLTIGVSSQPGNALRFDGFDDRVIIPDADYLKSPVISVEFWVNVRKLQGGFGRMILKRNSMPGYDDSYSIGIDSSFRLKAAVCSGTGLADGQRFAFQKEAVETDRWYYVAGVFRSDSMKLYVNGTLQESVFTGFPLSYSKNAIVLGFDERLGFSMDELRIFNTDRSAQILTDMCNTLSPLTPGLVAYYNFNTGNAGGQNEGYVTLVDLTPNGNNGVLTNFQPLSGNQSNWIESYAMVVPFADTPAQVSNNGFTASWKKPLFGGPDQYLLDVSTDPGFHSFVTGYHELVTEGSSHIVTGLQADKIYYYRVSAKRKTQGPMGAYSGTIRVKTNH